MEYLSEEEIKGLTEYAKEKQQVSVPQIQKDFGWSYSKARKGVDQLVEINKLKYQDGITYKYVTEVAESVKIFDEIDKYFEEMDRAFEEQLKKENEEPFEASHEEASLRRYVNLMNKLYAGANKDKTTDKSTADPPPKNTQLPDSYDKLPQEAKELVNMTLKIAESKKAAKFGLSESGLHCKSYTKTGIAYSLAINFVEKLTEKEFKRIKYILVNCQPQ